MLLSAVMPMCELLTWPNQKGGLASAGPPLKILSEVNMKKFLFVLAALALTGFAFASTPTPTYSPTPTSDVWSRNDLSNSGGRLSGLRTAAGLEARAGQAGAVTVRRIANVALQNGYVVIDLADSTYPYGTVGLPVNGPEAVTSVAGVVTNPSGSFVSNVGQGVDVAIAGDVWVQAVPLAITKGNMLTTVAASGQVTGTATAATAVAVAMETKTTTAADPLIRARLINR